MIDIIKKYFTKPQREKATGSEEATEHDIHVATCALFLEMAGIDGEFSEEEKQTIISILREKYDLSDEHIDSLMSTAEKELESSLDLWQFANLINHHYTDDEKKKILELAWQIVYIDGKLDKHEDYLMHRFSKLLRIPHREFIEAKLKVKRSLST